MDRLTPEERSANMRAVRRRNTAPEISVRRLLHGIGYRYRLNDRALPGSPDIVFTRRRKVIFVHGCFWHGHNCRAGRPPKSRPEYWVPKIERNRRRDEQVISALGELGWESLVIWQCEIKDRLTVTARLETFLGHQRTGR